MISALEKSKRTKRVYYLENIPEKHRQYPDTFEKPSEEDLAALKVGDTVKLIFCPTPEYEEEAECGGERMWVQITGIRNDSLTGTLDNVPVVFGEFLTLGDTIDFTFDNIADIHTES